MLNFFLGMLCGGAIGVAALACLIVGTDGRA